MMLKKKIWFGNRRDSFILSFDKQNNYSINCNNKLVHNDYSLWGLPYFLVFKKENYKSIGYSSTEVNLHLNKIYSLPFYLTLTTIINILILI